MSENPESSSENRKCSPRLERLATPRKRTMNATWQHFAQYFSPERQKAVRNVLHEKYGMTSKETSKYYKDDEPYKKKSKKHSWEEQTKIKTDKSDLDLKKME